MPTFNYITLIAALANLFLGILVLFRSRKNLYLSFAIFSFLNAIWVLTNFLFILKPSEFLIKSQYATGATVIPSYLVWFTYLLENYTSRRRRVIFYYCIGAFLLLTVYINDFIIKDLRILGPNSYELKLGFLFDFFSIILILLFGHLFYKLIREFRRARGVKKLQIAYVLLGASAFGGVSVSFSFVLPLFKIVPVAPFDAQSSLFMVAFTAYAIARHRLMDIRVVITRSIIYFLLIALVTLTLIFTIIVSVQYFGSSQTGRIEIAIIAALLIVFGLEPLKRVISRATDKIFFKARIDYETVLRKLSEIISLEIDIDKLVTTLTQTLAKELKIKQSIIILARPNHKPGRDVYEVRTEAHPHTPRIVLQPEDPLIKYFHEEQKMTVLEALERKIDDTTDEKERAQLEASRNEIEKIGAAVVAPIVAQNRLNAVLVLGPKLSGDSFSDEDLRLIEVLGPQIGSAIEKSKLYEEVKSFTKTLQNKVDQATSELKERNKFLLALQRVTNLITRTLDFNKVTQSIVNSISQELGYVGGLLLFIDKEKGTIYPAAITESSLTKKALALLPKKMNEYFSDYNKDTTLDTMAAKEGKIKTGTCLEQFISPPVPKLACSAINKLLKIKSIVAVPIFSENEVIGVIDFVLSKPEKEISRREREMMQSLADQTGIVARNLRLFEKIRKTAEELAEANERLKQLDQAKTEFVSIASHQLRTPMTGIMGYLSMLTAGDFGKLPPKHFKILSDLLGESQRMIRLINIFLNVSKIEAGKFELNKDNTVQLEDLIESEIKEVERIANAKNIKLEFKKPKEKLPLIHADPDKLKDVMLNLIDNAVKYTSEGSITISAEKMVNEIKISVKDSGVGIKPADAKQLFAKFSRGSGIARINPDGSGLGLFIAKKIIEGHEGQIWVESKGEGKGSTFSFTLPIK